MFRRNVMPAAEEFRNTLMSAPVMLNVSSTKADWRGAAPEGEANKEPEAVADTEALRLTGASALAVSLADVDTVDVDADAPELREDVGEAVTGADNDARVVATGDEEVTCTALRVALVEELTEDDSEGDADREALVLDDRLAVEVVEADAPSENEAVADKDAVVVELAEREADADGGTAYQV